MAWLGTWANRLEIIIDHTKIDTTLTDFPVLLKLSTSSGINAYDVSAVFDELTSDANRKKIAVTSSDGTTQLYVEIEKWDNANKLAWLHVRVPSVSSSDDTTLYLYYDSAQSDNTSYIGDTGDTAAQNVWDSGFKIIYHMAQDPNGDTTDAIKDSTSNTNHGTPSGSMTSADLVSGKVGDGIEFDGTDDCLLSKNNIGISGSTNRCLEVLIKTTNTSMQRPIAWGEGSTGNEHEECSIVFCNGDVDNEHGITITAGDKIWSDNFNDGNYHYMAYSLDGTNTSDFSSYIDGFAATYSDQNDQSLTTVDTQVYIGRAVHLACDFFNGIIDEVRISSVSRSTAWIKATYNSLWDTLLTFSSSSSSSSSLSFSSSSSSSISSSSSSFSSYSLSFSSSSSSSSSFSSYSLSFSVSSSSSSSYSLSSSSSSRSSSSSSNSNSSSSSRSSSSKSSSSSSFSNSSSSSSFSSSSSSSSNSSSSNSSSSSSSSINFSSSSSSSSSSLSLSSSSESSSSSSRSSSSLSSSSLSFSFSSSSSSKSIKLDYRGKIYLDIEVIASSMVWGKIRDWRGHLVQKPCTVIASSVDGSEIYGETISDNSTGYFLFNVGVASGTEILLTAYYRGTFKGQTNLAGTYILTTGSSSSSSSHSSSSSSYSSSSGSSSSSSSDSSSSSSYSSSSSSSSYSYSSSSASLSNSSSSSSSNSSSSSSSSSIESVSASSSSSSSSISSSSSSSFSSSSSSNSSSSKSSSSSSNSLSSSSSSSGSGSISSSSKSSSSKSSSSKSSSSSSSSFSNSTSSSSSSNSSSSSHSSSSDSSSSSSNSKSSSSRSLSSSSSSKSSSSKSSSSKSSSSSSSSSLSSSSSSSSYSNSSSSESSSSTSFSSSSRSSSSLSFSSSSRSSSSFSLSNSSSSSSSVSSSSASFSSSSRSSSSKSSSSKSSSSSSSSLSSSSSSLSFSSSSSSSKSSFSESSSSSSSTGSSSSSSGGISDSSSSSSSSSSSISNSLSSSSRSSSSLSSSSSSKSSFSFESISISSSSKSSSSFSFSTSSSSASSSSSSYASVGFDYYGTALTGLKLLTDSSPATSTLDSESTFANGIYYDVGWEDSAWDVNNAYGIDLGEIKSVDTIRIFLDPNTAPIAPHGSYTPWDPDENGVLSAYYSNDNSSWTLIDSKACNVENFPLRQYNVGNIASFDFIFSSAISARYFKLVNTGSYPLKFMSSHSYISFTARCAGELIAGYRTSAPADNEAEDQHNTVKWDRNFRNSRLKFYSDTEEKTIKIDGVSVSSSTSSSSISSTSIAHYNFCTWNPYDVDSKVVIFGENRTAKFIPEEVNEKAYIINYGSGRSSCSIGSEGRWYWEVIFSFSRPEDYNSENIASSGLYVRCGVITSVHPLTEALGSTMGGYGYEASNGKMYINGSSEVSYGDSYRYNNTVIGIAFDAYDRRLFFSKNGVWQKNGNPATGENPAASNIPFVDLYPAFTVSGRMEYRTYTETDFYPIVWTAHISEKPIYQIPSRFTILNI